MQDSVNSQGMGWRKGELGSRLLKQTSIIINWTGKMCGNVFTIVSRCSVANVCCCVKMEVCKSLAYLIQMSYY